MEAQAARGQAAELERVRHFETGLNGERGVVQLVMMGDRHRDAERNAAFAVEGNLCAVVGMMRTAEPDERHGFRVFPGDGLQRGHGQAVERGQGEKSGNGLVKLETDAFAAEPPESVRRLFKLTVVHPITFTSSSTGFTLRGRQAFSLPNPSGEIATDRHGAAIPAAASTSARL